MHKKTHGLYIKVYKGTDFTAGLFFTVLRSLQTATFFRLNFGAKQIGLTLSQSRLHTARRNFVRIIIFRIRVILFRFSQLSPLGLLLSLSPSLSSLSLACGFRISKMLRNNAAVCKDLYILISEDIIFINDDLRDLHM